MALIPCPECERELSEQAIQCPGCGHPIQNGESASGDKSGIWRAVIKSKTPINVFALAMMACASVFGFSSTQLESGGSEAFTYSLHVFLAVSGMFFVCLLFCRKAIYHPDDLVKAKEAGVDLGEDKPVLAAVLIAIMVTLYAFYEGGVLDHLLKD
ncbi:phage terminase large subunit family protein [Puniceicoccaceae bacterium K14]|nr:phage terminase large subunit family protein [Puniceicoccaceae bacterium K14]